jgi:hypothetical protein
MANKREKSTGTDRSAVQPEFKDFGQGHSRMQRLRQLEISPAIEAAGACKHHGEPGHEERIAMTVPDRWIGFARSRQIEQRLFPLAPERRFVTRRPRGREPETGGRSQCFQRAEITGIAPSEARQRFRRKPAGQCPLTVAAVAAARRRGHLFEQLGRRGLHFLQFIPRIDYYVNMLTYQSILQSGASLPDWHSWQDRDVQLVP